MNRTPLRRRLLAATVVAAAATLTAAPSAVAAPDVTYARHSGHQASVNWLEIGELPPAAGAPGNAHFGDLFVEDLGGGRADAFGQVADVQCEPGVTPYLPGGHGPGGPIGPVPGEPVPGEPGPAEGCVLLGMRFMQGGDLTFTIDRRLNRATLSGTLAVGSGHGAPTAAPPVKISWVGVGPMMRSRHYGTTTDQFGRHTFVYRSTSREARVAAGSLIGPMVFDDEPGEQSAAQLAKYQSLDRSRR